MFGAVAEFFATQQGDSGEFIEKARGIAIGVARDYEPARLYVVRIDNWFGPKWMHFAGKFTVGGAGRLHAASIGIHKSRLHVPPFVPDRVLAERVFSGPDFERTVAAEALHIECPSKLALRRRIADVDKEAAFVWFSGESETQGRGAVMVYLPDAFDETAPRRGSLRDCWAFYAGFSLRSGDWEPAMLRGVSRGEVAHLEEIGRAVIRKSPALVNT
jgi:hypothetical protein